MGSKKRKKQANEAKASVPANATRPPRGTKESYGPMRRKRNPVIFIWIGAAAGLLAIGADQQRRALMLDRQGKPAIRTTALAGFVVHRRSSLVAREEGDP